MIEKLGQKVVAIFKKFLRVWRDGRKSGYPRCCVLQFSVIAGIATTLPKWSPLRHQALQRGTIERDNLVYVPCLWHQRLAIPYPYEVAYIDEDGHAHLIFSRDDKER